LPEFYQNSSRILPEFLVFIRVLSEFYQSFIRVLSEFYLDLSDHPIGKYIDKTIPDEYTNIPKEVNEYFITFNINNHNDLINEVNEKMKNQDIGLFETNCEPDINNELQLEDIKELQKLFKPNKRIEEERKEKESEIHLDKYSVLHIRTGDEHINKGIESKILKRVEDNLNKFKLPSNVLLLSDSKEIKEILHKKYKYKIIESDIIHLGYLESEKKEQGIISTLIEFSIMCGAEKIYSLSVYDWISGFSTMASKLYNIPIEKYKI